MNLTKCKQNFANNPFRWDEESSTTKVSTERVQTSLPFAPPSSPNLSLSKCFNTSSDDQLCLPLPACYDFLTLSKPATKVIEPFDSMVAKASCSGDTTNSDMQTFWDEKGWEPIVFDVNQTTTIQSSYVRPLDHLDSDAPFIVTSPDDSSSETSFESGSEMSCQNCGIVEQAEVTEDSPGSETKCHSYRRPAAPPASSITVIDASKIPATCCRGSRSTDSDETFCRASLDYVSSGTCFDLRSERVSEVGGSVGAQTKVVAELKGKIACGGRSFPSLPLATPPNTPSSSLVPLDDGQTIIHCYSCQLPTSSQAEFVLMSKSF